MTDTTPIAANRTLPRRQPNSAYRQREYLTESEVERLIEAARKRGRNGPRDAAAILLTYRHGLRAQELCSLRWAQVDLHHGRLHVNRAKGGIESPSVACARAPRVEAAARQLAVCVHHRSRLSGHHCVVLEDGAAYRARCEATIPGPSAYAAPFDGLRGPQRVVATSMRR
jgi:integrase